MDIERTDSFLPVINLTEEVEKIALMKAALHAYTGDHERILRSVQRRLKAGQRQIDICTQESASIELKLSAVETKITEALLVTQDHEAEALQTVKDNRNIKRKIIALKNDIEQQEKILRRANETMAVVRSRFIRTNNKKIKVIPEISE